MKTVVCLDFVAKKVRYLTSDEAAALMAKANQGVTFSSGRPKL